MNQDKIGLVVLGFFFWFTFRLGLISLNYFLAKAFELLSSLIRKKG